MSRRNSQTKEKIAFAARLIELCETAEPAKVQRSLEISYQSAKNYLSGRYPDPEVLIKIGRRTGCSIDWLLTGRGRKFAEAAPTPDALLSAGQIDLVRKISEVVFDEKLTESGLLKTVKLQPNEIMSEKVPDESNTLIEKPVLSSDGEFRPA